MTSSTNQISNIDEPNQPLTAVPLDIANVAERGVGYVDAYVESELESRHARTERAIRQAQDQA